MIKRQILFAVAGTSLVLLAYLPSLRGSFVSDDYVYIVDNPILQSTPLREAWRFFSQRTNPYEYLPFRDLSYRFDFALFGKKPLGYRVHNLVLYAFCCITVWLFVFALSNEGLHRTDPSISAWTATYAAAFFAAHPAHVESVAWISGRKDLLSGFFALITIFFFIRALDRRPHSGKLLLISTISFTIASLSKATVLPVAFIALLIAFIRTPYEEPVLQRLRKSFMPVLPLIAVAGATLVLHLMVGSETHILRNPQSLDITNEPGSILFAVKILGTLVRIALLPVFLRLIYDLREPGIQVMLTYSLGIAALLATIVSLYVLKAKYALAAVGVVFFVITCLPFLQLIPFTTWSFVSERFLFLPLVGLALSLSILLMKLFPRKHSVAGSMIFLLLTFATLFRSLDWSSNETLVEKNFQYSPRDQRSVEMYVSRLLLDKRFEEALEAVQGIRETRARAFLTAYVEAQSAKAKGNEQEAIRLVRYLCTSITDESAVFLAEVANLALEVNMPMEAVSIYKAVLKGNPYLVAVRYNLGLAFKRMNRKAEASEQIRNAIDSGMRSGDAWNNLGLVYRDLGRYQEAETAFLSALRDDSKHWHSAYNLARLYIALNKKSEAQKMLLKARERAVAAGEDTAPIDQLLQHGTW